MTKSCKKRSSRKSGMKGGSHGNVSSYPPSAWGYSLGTVGNGWTQFMNSLTLKPDESLIRQHSNDIVQLKGGKKKHRKSRRKCKKGGSLLETSVAVLNNAAVPLSLFAMQNSFGKKNKSFQKTRKFKKY
jgi:hypothetical protein